MCGGRTFDNWGVVSRTLRKINPGIIIQGGAPGADRLAAKYAECNGIPLITYPALWRSHGKAAGPLRNAFMLRDSRATLVVAFPGGPGTAHMVKHAKEQNVEVYRVGD